MFRTTARPPRRRGRAVSVALCLLGIGGLLAWGFADRVTDALRIRTATHRSYLLFLSRTSAGRKDTYLVYDGGDPVAKRLELRGLPGKGVWLVDTESREVIASLNLESREFLDLNGVTRSPGPSLWQQAARDGVVKKRPSWMTPTAGKHLASGELIL